MVEKKIIKVIFYSLGAILLLIPMVRLAAATSELQFRNQGQGTGGANQANPVCLQTYVVQRGDTLSVIAQKFLGDLLAYPLIFQATNSVAGIEDYTPIHDPNIIEPGQVLCIPASPGASPVTPGVVVTGTGQITSTGSSLAGQTYNLTPEQGVLLVDNQAGNDIIFDLTQPRPGSAWIAPNHLQPFIVPAGLQGYMGHHPIGAFSIAPGQVQVTAGQITRLICFKDLCQLESLVQPSDQAQALPAQRQLNQPVVAGQPPPPAVDNDNIADNDNDDNDNDDNDDNDNDDNDNDNDDNDNDDNDND